MMRNEHWTLRYVFAEVIGQRSMNPDHSDLMVNQLVTNHLVGTLVKYGPSGRYEPYLAEHWKTSDDERVWRFTLRRGLVCEDNSPITAPDFVSGFLQQLKHYGEKSTPLEFAKLKGWDRFRAGDQNAIGVTATDLCTIEFVFNKPPVKLLEYIRMVYFGYYPVSNFEQGKWKDHRSIVSSGAFRLAPWDGLSDLHLLRRESWFSFGPGSPSEVVISNKTDHALSEVQPSRTIINKKLSGLEVLPAGFTPVFGTPTILNALVLSPYRKGLFDKLQNRKLFYNRFSALRDQTPFLSSNSKVAKSFYPSQQASPTKPETTSQNTPDSLVITQFVNIPKVPLQVVLSTTLLEEEKAYIQGLIENIFKGTEAQIEFHLEDRKDPNWSLQIHENKKYDIRVARVDIGGQLNSAVIRMMFCTTLGISFPDPMGTICKITDEFEAEPAKMNRAEYVDRFNQTLSDDSVVLPVFHSGLSWIYSNDIDLANVNPSAIYPRFDLIHLK